MARKFFIVEKTHADIDEMMTFCVNRELDKCRHSLDKQYVLLKTKEKLNALPEVFRGRQETPNRIFFKTDANWYDPNNEDE